MATALQLLPTSRDKSYQDFHLIPFSDYSRWERRPSKKPEASVPKLRSRALLRHVGPVQWTKPRLPGDQQAETARGEKAKAVSSNASTNRTKISIRSQEPPEIKMIKVCLQVPHVHRAVNKVPPLCVADTSQLQEIFTRGISEICQRLARRKHGNDILYHGT